MNSLHWVPVIYRSQYNILVYVFRTIHGEAMQYSEELLVAYGPIKTLRYTKKKTRGMIYGNRCFMKAEATLWNNLSLTIRKSKTVDAFKKKKVKPAFLFQLILYDKYLTTYV